MRAGFELTRVLITVLTYPHPSQKYQEIVCTAGVTENGEWIRLYPVDYRYRPEPQKFHKWQWIEVALGSRGHGNDQRLESREPDLSTLRLLGDPISTKDDWLERRQIIDQMPHHTVGQLEALHSKDRTSLGIVRPKRVLDLKVTPTDREWPAKYQWLWKQHRLFGYQKSLIKLPFKFQYIFECDDSDKTYTAMNEDWELGMLFIKEREKKGEEVAAQSVRQKFLNEICGDDKDTRFFMGTRHPYNQWLVIGTFWPPKQSQGLLPFSSSGS
ncbi:MAG: hypothetical protein GY794_05170 [bacterium]|nr:hypothetical protein [bacterium]